MNFGFCCKVCFFQLTPFATSRFISQHIKFLIDQQRYLELLEARHMKRALSILRDRLAPHNAGSDRLHHLSSLVICASPEELRARAKWPGAGSVSRIALLHAIEAAVLPSVMVPSRRLPELLEQAQLEQKRSDPYFNLPLDTHVSLYTDQVSDRSSFPTDTAAILTGHTDEVLHVAFSNNGTKLATAGKDKMLLVWSVGGRQSDFVLLHRLGPHLAAVWSVAWCPDDKSLLSTTVDGDVAVWNVENGTSEDYTKHHYEAAGAWLPDGRHFVTASMDASIVIWDKVSGKKVHTWKTSPFRVLAFDVSPDGKYLAAVCNRAIPSRQNNEGRASATGANLATRSYSYSESPSPMSMMAGISDESASSSLITTDPYSVNGGGNGATERSEGGRGDWGGGNRTLTDEKHRLSFYDLGAREELGSIYFYDEMSSVSFSHDSRQILVNRKPNEAQVWDFKRQVLLRRFSGHQMAKNVIRSCFGGATRNFVLSGSEDARVYIYHRRSGQLLDRLAGHGEGCVNSVAWHPREFALFASASDDMTVRIWRPKRLLGTALGVEEEEASRLRQQMDELERVSNGVRFGDRTGNGVGRRQGSSSLNGGGGSLARSGSANGSMPRSPTTDGRDGSVDMDTMGPTPFPWSVSPQHPSTSTMGRDSDENGDVNMGAERSREQQLSNLTRRRSQSQRGSTGGAASSRRASEIMGRMEVEVGEEEDGEEEEEEEEEANEDDEDDDGEDDEEGEEDEEAERDEEVFQEEDEEEVMEEAD